MVFQEPMTSLNPVFTCGEQLMEVVQLHQQLNRVAARKRSLELLSLVKLPNPEHLFNQYPHQLSGGQKQRIMIAIAMSCRPALLICDEPTTALDVTVQKSILALLHSLQQETGMGILFITHDLGVVGEIAQRALVMHKGRLVEAGKIPAIFHQAREAYTRGLLACRPALYQPGQRLPTVADFLTGKPNSQPPFADIVKPMAIAADPTPLLIADQISVQFPTARNWLGKPTAFTRAVDAVSFSVYAGETLGLVGESGSGKSTLGRCLMQLIPPSSGRIIYKGQDLSTLDNKSLIALRKEIQLVFQDPYSSLNPSMRIGEALTEPMRVHHPASTAETRRQHAIALLEKVGLDASVLKRYPHEFSGGQRQRIVIARALVLNPSFIICDESVSALDVSVQAQVLNLLNDLKHEFGFTLLFISHDLSVIRYLSDRILVLHQGRLEEQGPASQVYTNPSSVYTKSLIAAIPKVY